MKTHHIAIVVLIVSVALIAASRAMQGRASSDDPSIISTRGIHWHPELKIVVRGEEVAIPTNIGLIGMHSPMHTHDPDGIIHLEYEGVVHAEDITLGTFFDLWGKPFSAHEILEFTNTDTERVYMYVNGEESVEFEQYVLGEHDTIEIRYE